MGILLINFGTPEAATPKAVRKYLAQFLSDSRVVEIPCLIWWPILHGIILRIRPAKSAKKYARIWLPEGSPLLVWTQRQGQYVRGALGERLKTLGLPSDSSQVEIAMRYGQPNIAKAMQKLRERGCKQLLVLPMYPQYSCTTTASAFDGVKQALRKTLFSNVRYIEQWHSDTGYIKALATTINGYWHKHGRPDKLLMSFHGVPQYTIRRGDPYQQHCQETATQLARELGLQPDQWACSFQSRFGRAEWIKPYTTDVLQQLPAQDIKNLHVVCPGFPADCLETLEEIAIEGKKQFLRAGGTHYHYIPALNDQREFIVALVDQIEHELADWIAAKQR